LGLGGKSLRPNSVLITAINLLPNPMGAVLREVTFLENNLTHYYLVSCDWSTLPYTYSVITSVFLNMPVTNVAQSREFFQKLGFTLNDQFSGEDNVCVVVNPSISLMLMNHDKFAGFIDKNVAARNTSEMILSFQCESAEEVRRLAEKAFMLGARKINESEDSDFMFSWAFEDLDGHLWDLFWIKNPS
jgi:uncharacterized protein